MLKFNINIILHVFQQMNDMCWLWLFICVSIYIHISCVDLGFFLVTTHHLFSLPHRQRDVAIREKNKTTSKQSTTCRPPTKKTRTLRYAFGKKCISGPKSM